TGPTGLSITGPTGSMGLSITGPTGPTGLSITGPTGPTGLSITGSTGPCCTGPTGPTGFTGPTGLSITGPTGTRAPKNIICDQDGDTFVNTEVNSDEDIIRAQAINGIVITGTGDTGTTPVSGAGTRLMYHTYKGALRSGIVTSTQWDDFNIGDYSTAFGLDTIASGDGSMSYGHNRIGLLNAQGKGSKVSGFVDGAGSAIISFGDGSNISGYAAAGGFISALSEGSHTKGFAIIDGRLISAGEGSQVFGHARSLGLINATGRGSMASGFSSGPTGCISSR
ncbi:unnamed protein product, partial [marine sediment metagenome]